MLIKNLFLTCPATANPSASKEVAIQICKQIWNAAIVVVPCLAASDADKVTQNVTAVTLTNNRNPTTKSIKKVTYLFSRIYQTYFHFSPTNWKA